jgi:DNA-directed RNA polymerase specialized sigma24 family protein
MEIMDVSQGAFERLLAQLDPDRERAGERYELIRQKLTKFFQWRGCAAPEEYADETMDRVTKRIGEGTEIHSGDPYLFFHGVAINVLREYWKKEQRAPKASLDEANLADKPATAEPDKHESKERQLDCLDGCMQKLPPQHLTLVSRYHEGQGGAKIERRNELARELNIPLNALRIRVFRIRGSLESCISECVKRAS